MSKSKLIKFISFATSLTLAQSVMAWDHSVEIGYGKSHDPNGTKYYNSGFLLSGDMLHLARNYWSLWSLNGALGKWYTTAPTNKNLFTVNASLAVRLYPMNNDNNYNPYFLASVGPTILSHRQFGVNKQGSNITGQWNAAAGLEMYNIDVNFRYVHFSNGHLISPDQGFNIQYLLSIGYLF